MRLGHIISGDLWAGAEAMAASLLSRLHTMERLELTVIVLSEGELAQRLRQAGIDVHVVDEGSMSFRQLWREIEEIVVGRELELVHSHRYKENILAALVARWGNRFPLIATQHGLPELYGTSDRWQDRPKNWLNFQVLKKCFHRTVVVSEDLKNEMVARYGFSSEQLEVIVNGQELGPLPRRSFERVQYFGSVGRLTPVKNYPLLIEIARQVIAKRPGIQFLVAGDGPEKESLVELVHRYGLQDSVHFTGFEKDIPSFLQSLDVYINSSLHEGTPMSVLEAMGSGLPVIAPAVGGLTEIIAHDKSGILVEGEVSEPFVAQCLRLIDHPGEAQRIAQGARREVEQHYTSEQMAHSYMALYDSAVRSVMTGEL